MKKILMGSTLALGGLFLFATPLWAQTYQYVDTTGTLKLVVADSATEAIDSAPNRHPNSGVMVVGVGGIEAPEARMDADMETYAYVSASGDVREHRAATPELAIETAPERAPRSGVIFVNE